MGLAVKIFKTICLIISISYIVSTSLYAYYGDNQYISFAHVEAPVTTQVPSQSHADIAIHAISVGSQFMVKHPLAILGVSVALGAGANLLAKKTGTWFKRIAQGALYGFCAATCLHLAATNIQRYIDCETKKYIHAKVQPVAEAITTYFRNQL